MSAEPRQPYAWAIEYEVAGDRDRHVAFIRHDQRHDLAYAMQRAADLHGELVPLFTDRRTT